MENTQIIGNFKKLSLTNPSNVEMLKSTPTASWQRFQENCTRLQFTAPEETQREIAGNSSSNSTSFAVGITTTPHSVGSFPIEMRKRRRQGLERTVSFGIVETTVKARKSLIF